MSWRTKMEDQRKLKSEGAKLLWQRVTILVSIENDPDFLSWCDGQGTNAIDVLDEELADIGHPYGVLKTVLENFPKQSDWSKKLTVLIADTREALRRPRSSSDRASWKAIAEERQVEIERLRGELNSALARISELEKVIELMATGRKRETALTG